MSDILLVLQITANGGPLCGQKTINAADLVFWKNEARYFLEKPDGLDASEFIVIARYPIVNGSRLRYLIRGRVREHRDIVKVALKHNHFEVI